MKVLQLYNTTRSFLEGQIDALESQGVECTRVSVPGQYEPGSPQSVSEYARYYPKVLKETTGEYDLVHANYGLLTPFALAQPTRPVVLTLWGTDLMSDRTWLSELSRFGARHADAVVLPSRAMASELPYDHTVVPFGIDTEQFRPIPRREARARVGWDPDGQYVLFPYSPERPEKDFPRARRIVDQLGADVELKQIKDVPHDRMPYYLNASDAVLITSTRESGPMILKEAAACNVPVVSTDVGFARRTLADVHPSVVSDDDPELVSGLVDILRGQTRSNGREVLDGLGLDTMGERLAEVYRRALEKRGRSPHDSPSRNAPDLG